MFKKYKRIFFISLCVLSCSFTVFGAVFTIDTNGRLNATPALRDVLEYCNISNQLTTSKIVEATQKKWLRSSGTERWEVSSKECEDQVFFMDKLRCIGCIDCMEPKKKTFGSCLVLGCTLKAMYERLMHVKLLFDSGVRFKHIVLLGSERPLVREFENASTIEQLLGCKIAISPLTELGAIKALYENIMWPQEMRHIPVTYINSKMKKINGIEKRPTTVDTIIDWLKLDPQPDSCLAISNQPYIGYQHTTILEALPKGFTLETVGSALDVDTINFSLCLDAVARWIYQEYKNYITQNKGLVS